LEVSTSNAIEFGLASTGGAAGHDYSLRINGVWIFQNTPTDTALTPAAIMNAINAQSGQTGVFASATGSVLRLVAHDARDIAIGQTFGGGSGGGLSVQSDGSSTANGVVYRDGRLGAAVDATANSVVPSVVNRGTLTLSACSEIHIAGDGLALGFSANNHTINLDALSLATQHVGTADAARELITRVDTALCPILKLRSQVGAQISRLESSIDGLKINAENLSASRGRIMDADFAAETAHMVRAQILQQAGMAMLAQANASPNTIMALLTQR
jgi:flagellin